MKIKHWDVSVLGNKPAHQKQDIDFYTSDTDAHLRVKLTDSDLAPTTATFTLVNKDDRSVVSESTPVKNKVATYRMREEVINHSGEWHLQVVFSADKDYTTRVLCFGVGGYLLDENKPRLEVIENWNTLRGQVVDLLESLEVAEVKESERVDNEDARQANEQERVLSEDQRIDSENARQTQEVTRQDNEDERLVAEGERVASEKQRATKENERQEAETGRRTAETQRSDNEVQRINNEDDRTMAEGTRQDNEVNRQLEEADRADNEGERLASELQRVEAEGTRVTNETERKSAESKRVDGEVERRGNEGDRQLAETQREEDEARRQSAEDTRVTSETQRQDNEQTRQSAESTRQDNESTRIANMEIVQGWINNPEQFDGRSIKYDWRGTELGVRLEGDTEYVYVDLKGATGEIENLTPQHIQKALGFVPLEYKAGDNVTIDGDTISVTGQLGLNEAEVKKVKVDRATDADTVGGHTVAENVPADAVFTDTKTTINGKTGVIAKEDIVALGIPSKDTIVDISGKVDKVVGKNLSTNDYSNAEKQKVADTAEGLGAHQADDVSQGEVHGFRLTDGKLEYFDGQEWKRVKGDGYPVGNVSSFNAQADDRQITLTWTDPDDVTIEDSNGSVITIARWKGTKILRKTGSYPQNENDGVLVVDNGVKNQYQTNGFVDTGLTNDVDYYYMAFPYTEEDVFTVDENNRISAIPTEIKIYGVEIDESNSNPETSVIYTDDAIGFTQAKGNNGSFDWGTWENVIKEEFGIRPVVLQNLGGGNAEVNYALQYDDFTKKENGNVSNLTGTDGDVMIEFGTPLWWRFNRIGSKLNIQLSSKEFDGAVKHAFEIEDGYNQVPIYPLFLTQIIYLLMFKNLDSQTALGRGKVSSGYTSTGVTDDKSFNHGTSNDGVNVKFLGMEDYWGNRRWWIDGCFYDASRNILIGTNNFNDTGSGYENFGLASSADLNGYIDKVQGKNNTGFIPASTGGSATTYYADYGNVYSGRLPNFGGNAGIGDNSGAFDLYSITASNSNAGLGGRLFYSRDNKIYIGAYLGASQSSKLRSISGQTSHNDATIGAFRTLAKANN